MSQALYRKYRPQTFSEVIGQDHIKLTLQNQIKAKNIAHAYLFCGPRGIGKTTLARLVAKSINCLQSKNSEPCNVCSACEMIAKNKALDIIEIDAASHTGVDNVRENIISNALVSPSTLNYKVFIIDEVHMLSLSAFNALLKTLEEPPEKIIFILATTEIHKVPETIISRCQRFDFKKVSSQEIVKKLKKIVAAEKINVDLEVLERIARNSEGCARDAETLLSQILALDDKHVTSQQAELILPTTQTTLMVEFFSLIAEKNIKQAIEKINQLIEDGIDLVEYNKNFIEFLRKILLYKILGKLADLEDLDFSPTVLKRISSILEKITIADLAKMIRIFLDKIESLKNCPIAQLPLELAVIELINPEETVINSVPRSSPVVFKNTPPSLQLKNKKPVIIEEKINTAELDSSFFEIIKQKMPQIIKSLRKKNHALALTFSIATLVAFSKDNILTLGVKYKFHRDRLCESTNILMLEEVLAKELERPVRIKCLVDDKYETANISVSKEASDNLENVSEKDVKNVWDLAVNTFGE